MDDSKTMRGSIELPLEPDDIGVRYLAMRDLVKNNARELAISRKKVHTEDLIALVLANMNKEGYSMRLPSSYSLQFFLKSLHN